MFLTFQTLKGKEAAWKEFGPNSKQRKQEACKNKTYWPLLMSQSEGGPQAILYENLGVSMTSRIKWGALYTCLLFFYLCLCLVI